MKHALLCLRSSFVFAFFLALAALRPVAAADTGFSPGSFTILAPPGTQSFSDEPFAVNNSGQIVGGFEDVVGNDQGYLYSSGRYTLLHPLGSIVTHGDGAGISINDSGQVVGTFFDNAGHYHGFLYSSGNYTTMDVPGSTYTQAIEIDDDGQIVGNFVDNAGQDHGFLYSSGRYTTLDVRGSSYTHAIGINDSGQIVGTFGDNAGQHGYLYSPFAILDGDYDPDFNRVYLGDDNVRSLGTADLSSLEGETASRSGAVADGVTKLVLRLEVSGPGTVTFTAATNPSDTNPLSGDSLRRLDSSTAPSGVPVQTVNGHPVAFALYTVPPDLSPLEMKHPIIFTAVYSPADGSGHKHFRPTSHCSVPLCYSFTGFGPVQIHGRRLPQVFATRASTCRSSITVIRQRSTSTSIRM